MKKNKPLTLVMVILMLLVIVLFSYLSTLEGDDGQAQTYTFPTATPTTDLVGSGWWNAMPTPLTVEGMPSPTVTPTKKP